ncbi:PadR family transcriptional regulator [Amycolatopsis alkalitolerans]|uniref:PadR family transcriptional regulator n=1 Tax=Amycolatopsis alkalitolerans TaxID=2547244 RepID=A0A5C4M7U2_9PSEU|nr:PadR family transcriptional regulator [Amycolatopsis alkalitolerans]TNC29527.1 PadR family transcriptional regulator [Amycolatopsis alkalitolerans]
MSATRLLVLGVVRMYGRAHGYQVRRELLTWSADKWANVQPGSIYHALKKMTAEDLLELVEVEPGESGPERTAYRLTGEGETQFHVLLTQALSEAERDGAEMAAAITFMTALPRKRVIGLLQHRMFKLEADQRSAELLFEESTNWGQPPHVRELFRIWQLHSETSLKWLRELIERLEAGEYVMADDPGRSFGEPPR